MFEIRRLRVICQSWAFYFFLIVEFVIVLISGLIGNDLLQVVSYNAKRACHLRVEKGIGISFLSLPNT